MTTDKLNIFSQSHQSPQIKDENTCRESRAHLATQLINRPIRSREGEQPLPILKSRISYIACLQFIAIISKPEDREDN